MKYFHIKINWFNLALSELVHLKKNTKFACHRTTSNEGNSEPCFGISELKRFPAKTKPTVMDV